MMGFTMRQQRLLLLIPSILCTTDGFIPFLPIRHNRQQAVFHPTLLLFATRRSRNEGEVGKGSNWIERSFPVRGIDVKNVDDYNLGISGASFQTGELSKRMYDAIMSANFNDEMGDDIKRAFTLYAMDFTAKEATRAALKTNGLEMAVEDEGMEDEGMWGEVDSVQFLNESGEAVGPLYDSIEEAVDYWTPGQSFNFVVRQVPAKVKELSLEELLQALDPNGELREQANAANWTLPDEDINSLQDLARDVVRRSECAPREVTTEINAFAGLDKRGYRVISRGDLSRDSVNADGTENQITLMHVMDAMVSHGALVVDLTDGGTTYQLATQMKSMWDATGKFFDTLKNDPKIETKLPGMTSVVGNHAKVGYGNYDNGSMQFLEMRWKRDGNLLPSEVKEVLGEEDLESLKKAFDTVCEVGKDVVRIVTAAAGMDADVFPDDDGDILASQAATLLVDEVIDNGKLLDDANISPDEGPISMSPHRLCCYANNDNKNDEEALLSREVFGAHTDSSFITAVPVANISGLEVYDEAEERWYRPELAARLHWQQERAKRGQDPFADKETLSAMDDFEDGVELPWHARYVVLMPGEFLQIVSRNEVPAAVHRVVAGPAQRLSAPILLRGRPSTKLDVRRYLGEAGESGLLHECNGMSMDEIHSAMQPSSYQ